MPSRCWKFTIQDILEAIDAVNDYTEGMSFY